MVDKLLQHGATVDLLAKVGRNDALEAGLSLSESAFFQLVATH